MKLSNYYTKIFYTQNSLSGATVHEDKDLRCPSHYTWPFGVQVHEQRSRSVCQSELRPPVFKSRSKLGTHVSTHCSRDERLSRPCSARE
ncbi:uncharacterized protein TNCV_3333661 [Trichonephila clavipes]|nr:uncharacterized protein TNCV_3333661 [Trichonephila clavipes]